MYNEAVDDRLCCLDHEFCCELRVWDRDLCAGVEVVGERGACEAELVGEVVQEASWAWGLLEQDTVQRRLAGVQLEQCAEYALQRIVRRGRMRDQVAQQRYEELFAFT